MHDRGFLSRDLTPNNVTVVPDGSCRLVDLEMPLSPALSSPAPRTAGTVPRPWIAWAALRRKRSSGCGHQKRTSGQSGDGLSRAGAGLCLRCRSKKAVTYLRVIAMTRSPSIGVLGRPSCGWSTA